MMAMSHLHSHSRSSDSVSRLSFSLVPTRISWYDLLIIVDYHCFSFFSGNSCRPRIIIIFSVVFVAFVFCFMCFYCFCSIVISVFSLCRVVCRFILVNKPLIIDIISATLNTSMMTMMMKETILWFTASQWNTKTAKLAASSGHDTAKNYQQPEIYVHQSYHFHFHFHHHFG